MRASGAAAGLLLLGAISALDSRGQPAKQNESNAPEMASRDAPATFRTKVNLVMVPVVVRDSNGKAVGTLQKDDFQLFDKSKPQVISRFSVERAGEAAIPAEVADDAALENSAGATPSAKPAAPITQRFVIYLFDDVHTAAADLMQARNAADQQLSESLDATTRAAIFTTSGQGNVDFTDDRGKLHEALMRLMPRPTLGSPGDECPDLTYFMADLIVNKNDPTALQTAVAEAMASCVPPPPGNSPAAMQSVVQIATNLAQSTANRVLELGERDTRLAFTVLENAIRRLSRGAGRS